MNHTLLRHRMRRLQFECSGHVLNCVEHILPLRYTGLDGVVVSSSSWPPYHGRTLELWNALAPHCENMSREIPWITFRSEVTEDFPNPTTSNRTPCRFTNAKPSDEKSLEITVLSHYAGLGEKTITETFPDIPALEYVFTAHSQGWPASLHVVSKLFRNLPWRPRHETITWPQEYGCEEAIELFARHRMLDILGAFAAVSHDTLVAGKIYSFRSGHLADLGLIKASTFVPL